MHFNPYDAKQRHIPPKAAEVVGETVGPMLSFLGRLKQRLRAKGFGPADRLWKAAERDYDGVHELRVLLHYETCERSVTEPEHDWQI